MQNNKLNNVTMDAVFFLLPFSNRSNNFLEKNIKISFAISCFLGALVTFFFWSQGFSLIEGFEGKLFLSFIVANMIGHHFQYIFNAKAQIYLEKIENNNTSATEERLLHSHILFLLSVTALFVWFFPFTGELQEPFQWSLGSVFVIFLSGYLLAEAYNFILIGFYINWGILNKKFLTIFWPIVIGGTIIHYLGG